MSKVIVTYTEGKIGRKEVVQIEQPRFMDLVRKGVDEIVEASESLPEGLLGSIKTFQYTDEEGKQALDINYKISDSKIKIENRPNFIIRGVNVKTENDNNHGQLLSVDLETNKLIIVDKTVATNIVYVIKKVQEINEYLVNEQKKELENEVVIEENNEEWFR